MHVEDSPLERTPDLIARIRAMREQAEKQMDQFTEANDYDIRRVVGHGPKPAPVSDETGAPLPIAKRARKGATTSVADQTSMDFPPAPAEHGVEDGEEV